MAVNVIGFVYSALQSYDLVYFLSTGKHMIRNHFKQYFDFFIDQASFYFGLKLGFWISIFFIINSVIISVPNPKYITLNTLDG